MRRVYAGPNASSTLYGINSPLPNQHFVHGEVKLFLFRMRCTISVDYEVGFYRTKV